jgi:hypothetical protein
MPYWCVGVTVIAKHCDSCTDLQEASCICNIRDVGVHNFFPFAFVHISEPELDKGLDKKIQLSL